MKKTLTLWGCLLTAIFSVQAQSAKPEKTKAQARMNYFTEENRQAEIIVTGNLTPSLSIGGKTVALTPTDTSRSDESRATVYGFPVTELQQGDNVVQVTVGDSTYPVEITRLPAKENGVQIDYLTGVVHTGGLPFIPSGFYCYSPVQPTLAEEEVVRGMNLMSPYQNIGGQPRKERIAYLDRAAKLGMRVNYNLLSIAGGGGGARAAATDRAEKMKLLREEIRAVKDHPAILSWYVADEPEGQGISVETLEEVRRVIREEDRHHPISIVIMSAGPGREYAHTCDIIMTDPYPVPNSPAEEVIGVTRALQQELRYEKAIWLVPQTFGGAEWWSREPTPDEIRMMTWGSALEGARGFQAFIRHGLNGFPKNQYMWETYTKTCREIQELAPFFDKGSVSTPRVQGSEKLVVREYTLEMQKVVVLVNPSLTTESYKVILDPWLTGTAYNLSNNSRMEAVNGTLDGVIAPFGVTVLKLFGNPSEELAFLGRNVHPINVSNMMVDPSFEWEYSVSGNVPAATYGRVGKDRGATYAIDSRVAYHGGHSLRMTNPERGKGSGVSFYPLPLQIGKTYIMTVWAKADPNSLKAHAKGKKAEKMTFLMNLGGIAKQEFELTAEWKKYELSTTYTTSARDVRALTCTLELLGEGTAWFDMVEVVPDMDFTVVQDTTDPRVFQVVMNNHIAGGKIHYTLDGSEPTQQSPVYEKGKPIEIREVRVVKARVFGPDGKSYGMTEQQVAAHKGIGAKVTYGQPYTKYTGGGDSALVDGQVAALRYTEKAWQGFIGNDMEVVIDLLQPTAISRITSQYFHSKSDWIMPPVAVEYLISNDGVNFESLGVIDLGEAKDLPAHKVPVTKENIGQTTRYIKVIAKGHHKMPAWHSKDAAWMFADEVIVE